MSRRRAFIVELSLRDQDETQEDVEFDHLEEFVKGWAEQNGLEVIEFKAERF